MKLFPKRIVAAALPALFIVLTAATPNIKPETEGTGNGRDNTLSATRPYHFNLKPSGNIRKVYDNGLFAGLVPAPFFAVPNISYPAGAKTYPLNSAITPLTVTNTGGAVPASTPGDVTTLAGSAINGNTDGTGTAALFNGPLGVTVDASNNIYVADYSNHRIRKITSAGVVSTLAGSSRSFLDGTGTAAMFNYPYAVAADASGNVYVADFGNNRIRKITSAGVVTTLAGSATSGSIDALGTAATFYSPAGVFVNASGDIYVTDHNNNRIRKITSAGLVTTFAGSSSGFLDGTGTAAQFNKPWGITGDASGNLYVGDYNNNRIRKITSAGVVTTMAGSGTAGNADGTGIAASFNKPTSVTVDANGNIFVSDLFNYRIRKITSAGVVTTLAGSSAGFINGIGTAAKFNLPYGLAVDGSNNLYVAEYSNNSIRKITQFGYSISPALPTGLSFDATTGTISGTPTVITAATNYTVTAVNADGSSTTTVNIATTSATTINITGSLTAFSTCAGTASATAQSFTVNGNTLTADIRITAPTGFEIATTGGVYSSSLTLTQSGGTVAATAVFARLAATATGSPSGSITATSTGATDKGLAVNGTANVLPSVSLGTVNSVLSTATTFSIPYVSGAGSPNQYSVSTVSPTAMSGFTAINNASLSTSPISVSIPASAANTYHFNLAVKNSTTGCVSVANAFTLAVTAPLAAPNISYTGSTQVYRVGTGITPLTATNAGGVLTAGGGVSTFAGSGSFGSTDGAGTGASFKGPIGVALDASGTLFIADADNNKIRKITSGGLVTTFAGTSSSGSTDATGTLASFYGPTGMAIDASGNLYVSDYYGHKIRKITSAGVVSTLAGGTTSGSTDGTGSTAKFNYPAGVVVDGSGNVYVADQSNNKIRKITSAGVVSTLAGSGLFGSTDGTGAAASFYYPESVAIDASGNVFVVDQGTHKIRKITSVGVVSTFAGSGSSGSADGTGTSASFNSPYGITIDASGNLYVTDRSNHKIRKISSTGVVTTVAGIGTGGSLNNNNPTLASFYYPSGIAVDVSGNLFVTDYSTNLIRKISPSSGYSINPALPAGLSLDVTTGTISGTPTITSVATNYTITATNSTGSSATNINLTVVTATLTITGSLNSFETCSGSASTPKSFTLNGNNLTADIAITAPAGFELATTSGGVYSSSLTVTQSSGTVSGSQVFIRLAATATATTVGGTVTCTSSSATTKTINIAGIITIITAPATPVITGATALSFCSSGSVVLNSNGTNGSQWYLDGNQIANATSSSYAASTAGSYTVISHIAGYLNVCSSTPSQAAVVIINSNPSATIGGGSQLAFANCAATTVTLNANSGTGLIYQWMNDNGNISGATSQQYSVSQAGNYRVRVTDATNCFAVSSVTKILSISSATATGNTAVCSGGTVSLSANAAGFTNPTYQWLNSGTAISGATTANYSAVTTGNYSVSVTSGGINSNSCPVSVTVNPLPIISVSASPGNSVCIGTPFSINAIVSGTGSYQWLNNGHAISGAGLSSLNITSSGSYSVKVTDANGCFNTSSASTLTVNPLPTPTVITGTTVVKATQTTTLLSTPTGGTWSSSNTAVARVSSAGVVTGVVAGTVTISYIVTNTSGCSATVNALVTVTAITPKPIITAGSTTNLCSGGSVVLSSNSTSSNQWYKDGTVIGGASGGTFTATTAGSYTVAAGVDAVSSDAIQVTVNLNPDASIKEGAELAFSNCATTSITLTAVNTTLGTIYQWRNAAGDILNATNLQYTVTQADNYSLRVTDINNCTATSGNTKITAVPSASSGGSTVVCAGTSVTLSVNANSFTSPTYQWQNNGTNITGATLATYNGIATGNYTVEVTDFGLISTSCAIGITVNALPSVTITSNTTVCAGTAVNLAATTTATVYQWLGSGNAINTATTSSYTTALSDLYSVQVTDNNGCSNTSIASTVTVNPLPVLLAISGASTVCVNSTLNLTNTTPGGVWSSSNTAVATVDVTGQVTGIIAGTATITYTVTTNGCSTAVTKSISVNPISAIVTQPVANLVQCAGTNAGISITATGTSLNYQWYQNGTAITGATATTYSKTGLLAADAGNYSVVITGGCSNITGNASVWTVNPLPIIAANTGVNAICAGATTQLANTQTGGVWSTSASTVATINTSGLVTGVSAGTAIANYTLTSLAGCVSITSTNITVNPLPTVSITPANSVVVLGLTTQLLSTVGGGVTTYTWSPAANLNNATIANPVARVMGNTTYTLLVTNVTGCTASASTNVLVIENLFVQPTNVFTPNGDGINDRFTIKNLDVYPINTLQVFDRTGKILYERNNYTNDWDGTVSGRVLTKDTYYYVLTVKGTIVKRGSITLVR